MTHAEIADRSERAFLDGFNCAQSVWCSCAEAMGKPWDEACPLAEGFGGGMGLPGGVCGAVTGAYLAIGFKHGRRQAQDQAAKTRTGELCRQFDRRFAELHGKLGCRDLLGFDISTPEGRQRLHQQPRDQLPCRRFVNDAARIVSELLNL